MDDAVDRTIRIGASPAVVFRYLTDPELFVTWMGLAVELDPRPGGDLTIEVVPATVARGRYREVVPDQRLVFTWGWDGNAAVPPGSTTVTIELTADGDATVVRLRHDGLGGPEDRDRHRDGWQHYLGRLAVAATGVEAGPDPWVSEPGSPQSQEVVP